jgi:sorting nexin-8
MHNRENALLTQAVQIFVKEESAYSSTATDVWDVLRRMVEPMPME